MNIVIIGMGKFGSALSRIYQGCGHRLFVIRSRHSKADIAPENLRRSVVLLCVPTQNFPEMLAQRGDILLEADAVVSTAKGIIRSAGLTPLHYISRHLKGHPPLFALSGPSFAAELRRGQPTALTLAGRDKKRVDFLCRQLSAPALRLYKSDDPLGVELSGALKNVYAIASGMVEGLGFGDNTRAALTTRALSEMTRIGHALGGKTFTFFGLAGVGDLFLTCSSRQSRNYQYGLGLAKGQAPEKLLRQLGTVEGVWTASVASSLCRKRGLRAPLLETIVGILNNKLTPERALAKLMSRKVRHEFD